MNKTETVKFSLNLSAEYKDWSIHPDPDCDDDDKDNYVEITSPEGDCLLVSLDQLRSLDWLITEYLDKRDS